MPRRWREERWSGCSCRRVRPGVVRRAERRRVGSEFEREIAHACEGIKPGWVRVNFNYFISEPVFTYIVDAVRLIARDG
jgi:hypothetical protein